MKLHNGDCTLWLQYYEYYQLGVGGDVPGEKKITSSAQLATCSPSPSSSCVPPCREGRQSQRNRLAFQLTGVNRCAVLFCSLLALPVNQLSTGWHHTGDNVWRSGKGGPKTHQQKTLFAIDVAKEKETEIATFMDSFTGRKKVITFKDAPISITFTA